MSSACKKTRVVSALLFLLPLLLAAGCVGAGSDSPLVSSRAYSGHENDQDANNFVRAYPAAVGTRLDDCQLCHQPGLAGTSTSKIYNACSYCHLIPFPDASYSDGVPTGYQGTLNSFGLAYLNSGRNREAFAVIAGLDSDGDGSTNEDEIADNRFPGNPSSKPGQPLAPRITLTDSQVAAMTQHPQFLLLNANKQQYDFYATYTGPTLKDLLAAAGADLTGATGISVFAPDGFKQDFPLTSVAARFPDATFFDVLQNFTPATLNFVQYPVVIPTNPSTGNAYAHGEAITDLWLTLARKRDGAALSTSYYDPTTGRLEGEGPFRVIPPQGTPGRPDRGSGQPQASPDDGWNYQSSLDHNAGKSPRGACIIRINPMPAGVEEYDTSNGWSLIADRKLVIYGLGVH